MVGYNVTKFISLGAVDVFVIFGQYSDIVDNWWPIVINAVFPTFLNTIYW